MRNWQMEVPMDRERRRVLMLLSNPFAPDPRVYKEARTLTRNGYTVTIIAWDRQGNGQYPVVSAWFFLTSIWST